MISSELVWLLLLPGNWSSIFIDNNSVRVIGWNIKVQPNCCWVITNVPSVLNSWVYLRVDRQLVNEIFASFKSYEEILRTRGYKVVQPVNSVHKSLVIRTFVDWVYEGFTRRYRSQNTGCLWVSRGLFWLRMSKDYLSSMIRDSQPMSTRNFHWHGGYMATG